MKIAVLNETSAADRNADIMHALEGRGHEVHNAGMIKNGAIPELTYIHTGFLAALLLHTKKVDLAVGGCGTGQGFLNSVMQYPGVFCGHILTPLDAWLFTQINGGNCISLMLNQGYGWAGEVNLRMIFDQVFGVTPGGGFPAHRAESQKKSRESLVNISNKVHRSFSEIMAQLPDEVVLPALTFPGIRELLDIPSLTDKTLASEITKRMK